MLFFIGKRVYFYFSSAPTDEAKVYANLLNTGRTATLNGLPLDTTDIIFVGDSQTEKFPLNEMFDDPRVKNRGIGLNTSAHIVQRIPSIIAAHPAKIFLQMGLNDLGAFIGVDSILTNYRRVIDMIRQGSPRTRIYIQSMLPVSKDSWDSKWESAIERLNRRLKDYCMQTGIAYVDIFPDVYDRNGLDPRLTWDGDHLNLDGYRIWKKKIDSFVKL